MRDKLRREWDPLPSWGLERLTLAPTAHLPGLATPEHNTMAETPESPSLASHVKLPRRYDDLRSALNEPGRASFSSALVLPESSLRAIVYSRHCAGCRDSKGKSTGVVD